MKNPDRDETHARRRGNESPEDEVDGREVAERLYGGLPEESAPRCDNCGKRKTDNSEIGCTKCDPRARRAGMAPPTPFPETPDQPDALDE